MQEKLSKQIDTDLLFRITGKPGIWIPRAVKDKINMVPMQHFANPMEQAYASKGKLKQIKSLFESPGITFDDMLDTIEANEERPQIELVAMCMTRFKLSEADAKDLLMYYVPIKVRASILAEK